MEIGKVLRQLREERDVSIKELADELGISSSHISQIERGISSPSITMLKNISNVLDVPITYFFEQERETNSKVIRGSERTKFMLPESNFTYELLSPLNVKDFQFLMTRIEVGGELGEKPVGHGGKECCYISKGKVDFYIRDEVYQLSAGDSIYYPENTPHNVVNTGDEEAIIISVISPADF